MKYITLKYRSLIAFFLIIACLSLPTTASAWWGINNHHTDGYYWYRGNWWLGGFLAGRLPLGVVVHALPPSTRLVYVHQTPYYHDGTYYFQTCSNGFQVVADPARMAILVPAREVRIPAPPALRREVMPRAPYPHAVWVPGHWQWENRTRQYAWANGHWKRG